MLKYMCIHARMRLIICCATLSSLKIYSGGSHKKRTFGRVRDTINQRNQQMTSLRKWVWKPRKKMRPIAAKPPTPPTRRATQTSG